MPRSAALVTSLAALLQAAVVVGLQHVVDLVSDFVQVVQIARVHSLEITSHAHVKAFQAQNHANINTTEG